MAGTTSTLRARLLLLLAFLKLLGFELLADESSLLLSRVCWWRGETRRGRVLTSAGSGSRCARRVGRDVTSPIWTSRSATRGRPSQSRGALCWASRGRPSRPSDGPDGLRPRGVAPLVGVAWRWRWRWRGRPGFLCSEWSGLGKGLEPRVLLPVSQLTYGPHHRVSSQIFL